MSKFALVVAYPSTTKDGATTKFDWKHYFATHMPMIDKYWGPHGMKSWDVKTCPKEKSLDGSTPPYIVLTTIYWDSLDDMQSAMGTPESKETRADIPNFTDVEPLVWVSDIIAQNKL